MRADPTTTLDLPRLPGTEKPVDVATAPILDKVSVSISLDDEQRACLATKLDGDAELRRALGNDPVSSSRWTDLADLASDCINTVSFSAEWARAVQTQSNGTLTVDQLGCLRQGMAAFTSDDIEKIRQAGVEPEKADATIGARIDRLLAGCGVDKLTLAP